VSCKSGTAGTTPNARSELPVLIAEPLRTTRQLAVNSERRIGVLCIGDHERICA